MPAELRDEACAALIVCLKDSDGFVVSKAASALAAANTPAAVEPLVQAARDHPELASLILGTLASSGTMRLPAVPHLRKLCTHPNPVLRAAALTALCRAVPDEVEAELRAGLQDQADPVRRAAAVGLFSILQSLGRRPSVGQVGTAGSATWQQEVRAGTRGPAWLRTLPPLLQPLLKARDPGERLAAALALTALGHEDVAFPALVEAAQTQPALWARVADGLAWLPLPRRLELFNRLAALSKNPDQLTVAIYGLIRVRNPAEAAPLWRLCAAKKVAPDVARAILAALEEIACGQRLTTRERIRALTPAAREQVVAACRPRAEAGPATQRRIALALLLAVSPDAAAAAARKVAEDGKAEPLLRQNALQVLLLSRPRAEGQRLALGYLEHADPWLRRGAVGYLAVGPAALAFIGPEDIPLVVDNPSLSEPSGQLDRSVVTQVPPGLRPEVLLPLARDRDAWTSTSAGYLLVLMGRREGIEPLVRYWKSWRRHNDWLLRLVYRGIPALDDDSNVSVLEQIYRSFGPEDSRVPNLYAALRPMTGPHAATLRQRIRQETETVQRRRNTF